MAAKPIRSLLARPSAQLVLFVVLALALRWATFGDLNRHADETFYFLVGQRMHDGALPYVDVWDRKPFGLFVIYYLLAGISQAVVSYQVAACLSAGITAAIISRLVAQWSTVRGALLAGFTFLFSLGPFEGATGQTPDFYNPLIAGAAFLLVKEANDRARLEIGWRSWAAMLLCGFALTIKQTAIVESAFFGCFLLYRLYCARVPWRRIAVVFLISCALGAAPTVAIGIFYATIGHWTEFWHAMVISNVAKTLEGGAAWRALRIAVIAGPFLVTAAFGLILRTAELRGRGFVAIWTAAALLGFAIVPNIYDHYFLPVLVPLSIAAGLLFGYTRYWHVLALANVYYATLWYDPFERDWTLETNQAMRDMAQLIQRHDPGGGLLVFDGPVYLYALAGKPFLSPLVFPQHLNHQIENDVSHLRTHDQIEAVIAARPGVVVISRLPRSYPVNKPSRAKVIAYVRHHCRLIKVEVVHKGMNEDDFAIFGDCR